MEGTPDSEESASAPSTLFRSGENFMAAAPSDVNLDSVLEDGDLSTRTAEPLQAPGASTEPSAVLLISPRALQSQPGPDIFMEIEEIETFVFPMDFDGTQSVITIRVSRGKSQVNLSDPSSTYCRSGPLIPRLLPAPSMLIFPDRKSVVQFKSDLDGVFTETQPVGEGGGGGGGGGGRMRVEAIDQLALRQLKNPIFPSPILEQPFNNLKSDYDFYTPGQTMEAVRIKLERIKNRMSLLRETLKKKENSLKEMYLVSAEISKVAEPKNPGTISSTNDDKVVDSSSNNPPTTDLTNITAVDENSSSQSVELGLLVEPSKMMTGTVQGESEDEELPPLIVEQQQQSPELPPDCDLTSSTGITEEPKLPSTDEFGQRRCFIYEPLIAQTSDHTRRFCY